MIMVVFNVAAVGSGVHTGEFVTSRQRPTPSMRVWYATA